jgi:hypothetical protein
VLGEKQMKLAATLRSRVLIVFMAMASGPIGAADAPVGKNWTPPASRIYGQKLCDEQMSMHPELLSVTLHGVPPGLQDVYTMFAGSYPDRIGNPDDPDDIDVSKKGITILDPRWHRTNDKDRKFVVLMPMRDRSGQNIGLVVYAFKNPKDPSTSASEVEYFTKAAAMRDGLAARISNYQTLFDPSN